MSNAQKYNDALNLNIKHSIKFNDAKARCINDGFDFSDEEFAQLYRLINGSKGEIKLGMKPISDNEANQLDNIVNYLCAHGNEWSTFTDVCVKTHIVEYDKDYWGQNKMGSEAKRNRFKQLFDRLVDKKIFSCIERVEFKTNNTPVLHVYRAC